MPVARFRSAALVGAIFLSFGVMTGSASAVTMIATYTGKVSDSANGLGLFGLGASLDGSDFVLRFFYNPSVSGANSYSHATNPGAFDAGVTDGNIVEGGFGLGDGSVDPVISAMLTINGQTETLLGSYSGFVQSLAIDPLYSQMWHQQYDQVDGTDPLGTDYTDAGYVQIGVENFDGNNRFPLDLETAVALIVVDGTNTRISSLENPGDHYFQFEHITYDSDGNQMTDVLTYGNFVLETYQISPVPVPAALPLMLSGLGALGFAGWRRRKVIAAKAA